MSSPVNEQSSRTPRTTRGNNGFVRNSVNNCSTGEEVRTLFVSGLPMDVRLRELYLLFRCYEGYEGSFLKLISSKPGKPPQPIAFVSFDTRKQAEKALEELQGVHFDPASAQTLRLEFARTNSRVSPKQQSYIPQQQTLNLSHVSPSHPTARNGQYLFYVVSNGSYQFPKGSSSCLPTVNTAGQNVLTLADCWAPTRMHNIVPPVSYANGSTALSPASSTAHMSVMSILSDSESSAYPTPASTPEIDEPNSVPSPPEEDMLMRRDGMVTSAASTVTLSVANLDPRTTEEEVHSLFSSCPGFVKLEMNTQDADSSLVAFVEFSNAECAKFAMEKYQGYNFVSSSVNGVLIDYVKQDHLSSSMECSSSPSSNGTLSPVLASTLHPNTYHSQTVYHQTHQPSTVQVIQSGETTNSMYQNIVNGTPVHFPATNFKGLVANAPSYVYPGPLFMNS